MKSIKLILLLAIVIATYGCNKEDDEDIVSVGGNCNICTVVTIAYYKGDTISHSVWVYDQFFYESNGICRMSREVFIDTIIAEQDSIFRLVIDGGAVMDYDVSCVYE